jgi:transcriptional regulator with XRE-family HTH domain
MKTAESRRHLDGSADVATVTTPSLRHCRTQAALRQSELATRAGVSKTSVRRGETGQPLQLATVHKLADALGVSRAELQRQPPET